MKNINIDLGPITLFLFLAFCVHSCTEITTANIEADKSNLCQTQNK